MPWEYPWVYNDLCESLQESLRSFPILCTVDVPQVALRTALFVSLHDSGSFPSGAGSEAYLQQAVWERDVSNMQRRVSTRRTLLL